MKRLRWLVLLAVIASVALSRAHRRASAVRYNGRSIETWFDELNRDGPATNAAKVAIIAIGSNAVPFLVTQLTSGPVFRDQYLHFKAKLPSAFRRKLPAVPRIAKVHWDRRERATAMLGELGPTAKSALPALVSILSYVDWNESVGPNREKSWLFNPRLRMAALLSMEQIDDDDPRIFVTITAILKEKNLRQPLQLKADSWSLGRARNSAKELITLRKWEYTGGDFLTVQSLVSEGWTLVGSPLFDSTDAAGMSILRRRLQ